MYTVYLPRHKMSTNHVCTYISGLDPMVKHSPKPPNVRFLNPAKNLPKATPIHINMWYSPRCLGLAMVKHYYQFTCTPEN